MAAAASPEEKVQQLAEEPARAESSAAKEDSASTTGLVSVSTPTAHDQTKADNEAKDAPPVSEQKVKAATASTAVARARTDKKAPEVAEPGQKDTKEEVPGKDTKASERKGKGQAKHRLFDLGLGTALGLDASDASADPSEAGPGRKRSSGRLKKLGLAALVEPGPEEGTLPSATQEEPGKDADKHKESREELPATASGAEAQEKQRPKRLQSLGLASALSLEGDGLLPDRVHPGSEKDTEGKEVPIPKANDTAKLDTKKAAMAKVVVWKNKADEARAAGQAAAAAALEAGKDAMQASSTGTAELLRVGRERGKDLPPQGTYAQILTEHWGELACAKAGKTFLGKLRLVNLAAELALLNAEKPVADIADQAGKAAAKAAESTGSFATIRISTLILQVFRHSQRHGAPPAVQATKGAIAAAGSVMAWTRNPDGLTEEILNTVAQGGNRGSNSPVLAETLVGCL
ncbi:unnamed protein product [Symbiodinium sp. CCMP2456]|nr:unnamed protein product [Symbiodinium sp. CCMP2456]